MPRDTQSTQERFVAANRDTKHHHGLWRGQLVHPQFGVVTGEDVPLGVPMEDIVASGDPITDAKGLGIRFFWRAPKNAIPHFFIRDDHYFAVMQSAFPTFHHAAVRVLAKYVEETGYAGLRKIVACDAFPKTEFSFGVFVEHPIVVNGTKYQPDILIEHHAEGYPRIELEVVNRHWPEPGRLRAARAENALVLCMNIYDLVQECVMDGKTETFVPSDRDLLERLKRLRFTDGKRGDSAEHHNFQLVWLDKEHVPYLRGLRKELRSWVSAVVKATDTCDSLSGGDALDRIWICRMALKWHNYEQTESWALARAGMEFNADDRVAMPSAVKEIDSLIQSWANASVTPPGIAREISELKTARKKLNLALDGLLSAAERMHDRALEVRREEIILEEAEEAARMAERDRLREDAYRQRMAEEAERQRLAEEARVARAQAESEAEAVRRVAEEEAEAIRKVRAPYEKAAKTLNHCRSGLSDAVAAFKDLKRRAERETSQVRIHRRGPLAGQVAKPYTNMRAQLAEEARDILQKVQTFRDGAQPFLGFWDAHEKERPDCVAEHMRNIGEATDDVLDLLASSDLPTKAEVDALVQLLTKNFEDRL